MEGSTLSIEFSTKRTTEVTVAGVRAVGGMVTSKRARVQACMIHKAAERSKCIGERRFGRFQLSGGTKAPVLTLDRKIERKLWR